MNDKFSHSKTQNRASRKHNLYSVVYVKSTG